MRATGLTLKKFLIAGTGNFQPPLILEGSPRLETVRKIIAREISTRNNPGFLAGGAFPRGWEFRERKTWKQRDSRGCR